jgi:hypothetical protein
LKVSAAIDLKAKAEDLSREPQAFETAYPNLARWVDAYGWLEIGADEYSTSLTGFLMREV